MEKPSHLIGLEPDNTMTFGDWSCQEFLDLWHNKFKHSTRRQPCAVLNGCFDLFHLGHANLLRQIHAHIEYNVPVNLVVLVNSDESVRRLKGARRPYYPLSARMSMLTLHPVVKAVAGFDELTPEEALAVLKPDLLFKGAEYEGTDIPGQNSCGSMVFLQETPGFRTTELERRIIGSQQNRHDSNY